MNPSDISQRTLEEAKEILSNTKVLDILANYGDVRIGGSFLTGLMLGPDIDITLATDTPRESAVKFVKGIIEKRLFQKVEYGDFEKFPRKNRNQDHIVVLVLEYKNRKWEIEIWFTRHHYEDQIELEEKLIKLPANVKSQIIEAKYKRDQNGLGKHSLSSVEIYKSFLSLHK